MADFRPGRPGFMMYFDWVDAIRRMAESETEQGREWALAMFFAIADYAEGGTLPTNPFVDMAISGYMHTIERDSEKYWKQVDGSHKGGENSAAKRKQEAEEKATATEDKDKTPLRGYFGSIFVDTDEGTKPLNVGKELREDALRYSDDVHFGKTPKPPTGSLVKSFFDEWLSKKR